MRIDSSVSPKKSRRIGSAIARREKIENAAAHRIFAAFAHSGRAGEAIVLEPLRQRIHIDRIAGGGGEGFGGDLCGGGTRCRRALMVTQRCADAQASSASAPDATKPSCAAPRLPHSATRDHRAGSPRREIEHFDVVRRERNASWNARARCPSRATWTRATARSSAAGAGARVRSATQNAS